MNVERGNQFVVDLLTTLRAENFRLAAWWHFLKRSWDMSCATARANPGLYRSWVRTTIGMAALVCCLFCMTIVSEGFSTALRLLQGLMLCVGWQQCDLFWHLGLNRITYEIPLQDETAKRNISRPEFFEGKRPGSVGAIIHSAQIDPIYLDGTHEDESDQSGAMNNGPYTGNSSLQALLRSVNDSGQLMFLRQRIGLANIITLLRGLCSAYLLARILAGLSTPDNIVLVVFLSGCVTDLLDGVIARGTGTCSKLGQILDSEIDFTFYLLVSIVLLQNGLLPLWLCVVLWLRFCLPLCAALGSYFVLARPLRICSTIWGKCAGVCQALYVLVLLAPPGFSSIAQPLRMPLLIIVLALFVAALIAQAFKAQPAFSNFSKEV